MNTQKLYFLALLLITITFSVVATPQPPLQRSTSPYYINDWIKGQITFNGNTEHENIPLKYNVYDNQLEVKRNGKAVPVKSEGVRGFIIGPPSIGNLARFERAQYIDGFDEVSPEQFVQLIYQSESKLMAVHKKQQIDSAKNQYTEAQTTFYYMSPEGKVTAFEPDKETMLKLLVDKQEAVRQFIEAEKIDFTSIQDITTVVAFYDSTGEN